MKTIGVILGSGTGSRAGSYIPKQFVKINGRPVFHYVVDAFYEAGLPIILTVPPGYKESQIAEILPSVPIMFIEGGKTRTETVRKTFSLLQSLGADFVVFHDAARPMINAINIRMAIDALAKGASFAITVEKITDGLAEAAPSGEFLNRDNYRLVQTPEAFRVPDLIKAYEGLTEEVYAGLAKKPTVIASQLIGNNKPGVLIERNSNNFKITYPEDIRWAEKLLADDSLFPAEEAKLDLLLQKNIAVFGASGGIGKPIADLLETYGSVARIGRDTIDLSKSHWEPLQEKFDYVVYAAGLCFEDKNITPQQQEDMFGVNAFSVATLMRNAQDMVNPGGSVLVIGSSSSTMGRKGFGLYSASKMSANAIVQAYASKLYQKGIRVNCLCPTKTKTPMVLKTMTAADMNYILEPEYVARAALKALVAPYNGKIWYLYKGLDI